MDEERENQIEADEKQQLIKLKIIKSSDWNNKIDQEISSISPPPPPPPTHICEDCGKGFSSGKALGGHKRYHIQEARKNGEFIPRKTVKLKLKKHTLVGLDDEVKINNTQREEEQKEKEKEKSTCCLCQKEFPSKKSLFGHMRSHRDRDWRGIQPPPEITIMSDAYDRSRSITSSCSPPTAAAAPEEEAEASLDQLTESRVSTFEPVEVLGKWRKTDKRGRKSTSVGVGGGDRVAAERLVSLSLGGEEEEDEEEGGQPSNLTMRMKSGYDSDDSYWLREDQELLQEEHDHHVDHIMQSNNLDCGVQQVQGIIQILQQPNDHHCDVVVSNKRKMTTTKKLEEKIINRPRKKPKTSTSWFKCSSCGKSFPTFQALGGHRSSHNKDKHNMSNINQHHQAPLVIMNSEASESSQTGPRKVLDFDLNETYVMEDDHVEEGA